MYVCVCVCVCARAFECACVRVCVCGGVSEKEAVHVSTRYPAQGNFQCFELRLRATKEGQLP